MRLAAAMARAAKLKELGFIEHIGICNASVAQVETATKAAGCRLACIETCFSIYDINAAKPKRKKEPLSSRRGLLDYCERMGIIFMPHGALGGLKVSHLQRPSLQRKKLRILHTRREMGDEIWLRTTQS